METQRKKRWERQIGGKRAEIAGKGTAEVRGDGIVKNYILLKKKTF